MEDFDKIVKICKILKDNKAENIICIDTSKSSNIANFFILATANSVVHIKSLIDFCYNEICENNIFDVYCREGFNTSKWQVLDLGEGFVHIFTKEEREKYNIEKLLGENKNTYSFDKLLKIEQKNCKKLKESDKKVNRHEKKIDGEKKKKINNALSKISRAKK